MNSQQNKIEDQTTNTSDTKLNKKHPNKVNIALITVVIIIIIIALIVGFIIFAKDNNKNQSSNEINSETKKSAYWISGNSQKHLIYIC